MSEDKEAFLQNFKNSASVGLNNAAGLQRRRLVHLFDHSKRTLDEESAHYVLEKNLQEYAETMDEDDRLNNKLKSLLMKSNITGPVKLQSGLQNINFREALKPLTCYEPNTFKCPATEATLREDFSEFMASARKTSTVSKINQPSESQSKKPLCDFKTATEELHSQNLLNKGQKRRVGLSKRGVNSKFVPPVMKRNDSSDASSPKSEEWAAENVDERLKSIDPKMVELIRNEIMDIGTLIQWDDIAGLEFAKNAIKEAVVWPMLRPDIFRGLRRPPKGILLFGPPGTGKTLIGKCVAAQSKSTFFSISASSLTSKWIGEGEKMVRALFAVARVHQPAVIFIDEVDSLLTQRSETEHESSRRIKTEFLVQLDGAATDAEERLLIIGATNRPQELDEAARRRFTKRLYIPLPECEARFQLVKRLICEETHDLTEANCQEVARLSDGYSGADIRNLCSEAALGPIRNLDPTVMEHIRPEEVRPLAMEDFLNAFRRIRSSVAPKDLEQYVLWDSTYGSGL